jgi:hypothetical protein
MNTQIHFMKNVAIIGGLLSIFAHGACSCKLLVDDLTREKS